MAEGGTRRGPVSKHGAKGKVDLRERDRVWRKNGMVKLGERGW